MLAGIIVCAAGLIRRAAIIWHSVFGASRLTAKALPWTGCMAVACLVLHALSFFSDSFIMAEGHVVAFCIATLTLALTSSALALVQQPLLQASHERTQPACQQADNSAAGVSRHLTASTGAQAKACCLGAGLLLCNWAVAQLGLLSRGSADAMQRADAGQPSSASLVTRLLDDACTRGGWGLLLELVLVFLPVAAIPLTIAAMRRQRSVSTVLPGWSAAFHDVHGGLAGASHTVAASGPKQAYRCIIWAAHLLSTWAMPASYLAVGLSWACRSEPLHLWMHYAFAALRLWPQALFAYACDKGLGAMLCWVSYAAGKRLPSTATFQLVAERSVFLCAAVGLGTMMYMHSWVKKNISRTAQNAAVQHHGHLCRPADDVTCSNAGNKQSSAADWLSAAAGSLSIPAQQPILLVMTAPIMLVMGQAAAAVLSIWLLQQLLMLRLLETCHLLSNNRLARAHRVPHATSTLRLCAQCTSVQDQSWAAAAAMLQTFYAAQLYFCTGHLNEFAGLHYAAGGLAHAHAGGMMLSMPS